MALCRAMVWRVCLCSHRTHPVCAVCVCAYRYNLSVLWLTLLEDHSIIVWFLPRVWENLTMVGVEVQGASELLRYSLYSQPEGHLVTQ